MVAKRWRYVAGVVATAVMATVWLPACRDRPTLQREVASPSVSCSQREG
jgi:hypothetical protein